MIARDNAPSVELAWPVVERLIALCPSDHHPIRVHVEKSGHGRRAHVTVTVQRNRLAPPA